MEWKPVPGFPHLEASDSGLVRSIDHVVQSKNRHGWCSQRVKGRVLKGTPQHHGHLTVSVRAPEGSKHKQMPMGVHVLVCRAFHGPPPEDKPMALHGDGNPANNVPGNLRWGTHTENMRDKLRHGTMSKGESHGMTKLTAEQVAYIRETYKAKTKDRGSFALAAQFGVHRTTIENIVRGTTWG